MHERKALMAKRADAFIALPGGFGTFDELFEIITWAQLGLHHKPMGLLDVGGFFQPLLAMVRRGVEEGFIPEAQARPFAVERARRRAAGPAAGGAHACRVTEKWLQDGRADLRAAGATLSARAPACSALPSEEATRSITVLGALGDDGPPSVKLSGEAHAVAHPEERPCTGSRRACPGPPGRCGAMLSGRHLARGRHQRHAPDGRSCWSKSS